MTINPKLQLAIDALNIQDVVLRSIETRLHDDVYPGLTLSPTAPVSLQLRGPTCIGIERFDNPESTDARVCFTMEMAARVLDGTAESLAAFPKEEVESCVVATIITSFYLYFDSKANPTIEDDCLSEFGKHNAGFIMWPYWREVMQSACSRMCLPKIVLPTHKLKKSVETESKPQEIKQRAQLVLGKQGS